MGVGNIGKVEIIKDYKKEIEFWFSALSNQNINSENKKLLNMCLQIELNKYLFPPSVLFSKTDIPNLDDYMNRIKPYSNKDYEDAKKQGYDLDDWDDYCKYFGLGEEPTYD